MSAIPERHAGEHIVVSGAGTGIGRAIALRLGAEGAQLSLCARDAERLRSTAAATRRAISGAGPGGEPSGSWPVTSSVLARLSAMRSDSM